MKSTEFLQAAIDVQAERGKQYDKPSGERSMGATISAFNCITGRTLEESDGWLILSLLKLVRQAQNPEQYHHDSALDFVAYASLYAESASEQCGQVEIVRNTGGPIAASKTYIVGEKDYECHNPINDGWIHWEGGSCPVISGASVDVMFRDANSPEKPVLASAVNWKHRAKPSRLDITAYRIARNAK
jgi:hypothetical protein